MYVCSDLSRCGSGCYAPSQCVSAYREDEGFENANVGGDSVCCDNKGEGRRVQDDRRRCGIDVWCEAALAALLSHVCCCWGVRQGKARRAVVVRVNLVGEGSREREGRD